MGVATVSRTAKYRRDLPPINTACHTIRARDHVPKPVSENNIPSTPLRTGFGTVKPVGHLLGYAR